MTTTCEIRGRTSDDEGSPGDPGWGPQSPTEAPGAETDPPSPEQACRRDEAPPPRERDREPAVTMGPRAAPNPEPAEPAYESDLHGLIALARAGAQETPHEEVIGLEAPASVREAIRLAEALLPPPVAVPVAAVPARRLRVAALPVIALAIVGVVLSVARGSRGSGDSPELPPPMAREEPSVVHVIAAPPEPPVAPAMALVVEPAPADQAPSIPTPAPAPAVRPIARAQPAVASRPRPNTAAPSAAAALDPPSLMQAITEAVRSGARSSEHR